MNAVETRVSRVGCAQTQVQPWQWAEWRLLKSVVICPGYRQWVLSQGSQETQRKLKETLGVFLIHATTTVCVSCSAMSDSLQPHGLQPTRLLCPEIFQARKLEWVAISFSRESSWCRDWTWVSSISCISRRILYHWATWEAITLPHPPSTHCW